MPRSQIPPRYPASEETRTTVVRAAFEPLRHRGTEDVAAAISGTARGRGIQPTPSRATPVIAAGFYPARAGCPDAAFAAARRMRKPPGARIRVLLSARTTLSTSSVQPRASWLILSKGRNRANCRRTMRASVATPPFTTAMRASGGILLRRMLQPTQFARRAVTQAVCVSQSRRASRRNAEPRGGLALPIESWS